ncbi:MAG: response regulator transcription factor [Oscillospiraceae bacterium]|nr:response regulator transcription factor [Oscillospiraceae bacterium]
MDILLADPDRDILMCYRRILSHDGHDVTTAFDGTQVIGAVAGKKFDLVILSGNIPRVSCRHIVELLNEENIPVIVTLDRALSADMLMDRVLPGGYLEMPFSPQELRLEIDEVSRVSAMRQSIRLSEAVLEPWRFTLPGDIRLTAREADMLRQLCSGLTLCHGEGDAYISALNNKLGALNKSLRIQYKINEGYRLVTGNEQG